VAKSKRAPARRRPPRGRIALRWLAVGVTVLVAFLYYQPLRTYLKTREDLDARLSEVRSLRAERLRLERRLAASTSAEALLVEARRLGFVKPGERLFIVKGISSWRKEHKATIGGGG
jgi:cell division protein FtsB